MGVEINESIQVTAHFRPGAVQPVWFRWNGRQVWIKETPFTWKTRQGRSEIIHFSVTDGTNLYEISYDKESMGWRIVQAE